MDTDTDTVTIPTILIVRMTGNPIVISIVEGMFPTVTKRGEVGILGEITTRTTVIELEFTFGSGTDNKSVITNKLHEVT